jgi:hypothetical protein
MDGPERKDILKAAAMPKESLRYALRTFRRDQLWLPGGFWALFALLVLLFRADAHWIDMVRGYLGAILPLSAGILAAYAVLDDPALEIVFSTPITAGRLLAARLGPILAVMIAAAASFQVLILGIGFDLRAFEKTVSFQFSWLIPVLTLTALGAFAALASKNSATGALFVGAVWIIQLIARGWFLSRAMAGYALLFMGIFNPRDTRLTANRIALGLLAAILAAAARKLLQKQERYL